MAWPPACRTSERACASPRSKRPAARRGAKMSLRGCSARSPTLGSLHNSPLQPPPAEALGGSSKTLQVQVKLLETAVTFRGVGHCHLITRGNGDASEHALYVAQQPKAACPGKVVWCSGQTTCPTRPEPAVGHPYLLFMTSGNAFSSLNVGFSLVNWSR